MIDRKELEIFLACVPGLESALLSEVTSHGFKSATKDKGGITLKGTWQDVWRANLLVRGASHVLVRLGNFRALHLAQLDKRARKFPWLETLKPDVPVRVEATCKKSRIYHHKAATQRIENALTEEAGISISKDADVCIKLRILDDMCTISVDSSGEPLHKRGHKKAVNKAPMRENLAALLLRQCGYDGSEPVIDPMCGSGTFVIEAAEIAEGLYAGRTRKFAFEQLVGFNHETWLKMKSATGGALTEAQFYGFDRDKGAVTMSAANAERSGVEKSTRFATQSISALSAPDGPTGLVIVNPPYGARVGDSKKLRTLYQTLGKTLLSGFTGWRVGLVTNSEGLSKATKLPFRGKPLAFSHGGIPVKLFKTGPLNS